MEFIKFPHKVHTIFFMLGFACNFNCKYCLQHEFKSNKVCLSYNPQIIDFIKEQTVQNKHIDINFFGGEPLLYFNVIKDVVHKLKSVNNISFSMLTNGSLLNDDTVTFINENNISVGISWDGRNTKLSRGVDIFETNKENIFKLKRPFFVSSVFNAYNSPVQLLNDLDELNEEYKKIYDVNMSFNIDNLYYLDNINSDVFLLDFKKYEQDLEYLIDKFINDNENITYAEFNYINGFIESIKQYDENYSMVYSPCMNGIHVLNLDLQGNLYLCHDNSDKILGNIYSSIEEYTKQYRLYNNILPNYCESECKECSVRFCCSKGCMLLSKDELKIFYCVQKKSILEPIINKLIEFSGML